MRCLTMTHADDHHSLRSSTAPSLTPMIKLNILLKTCTSPACAHVFVPMESVNHSCVSGTMVNLIEKQCVYIYKDLPWQQPGQGPAGETYSQTSDRRFDPSYHCPQRIR